MPTCPCCNHTWVQTRKKKEPKEKDPNVREIIRFYMDTFFLKFGAYPHMKYGAAGTVAKRLIKDNTDSSGLYDGDKVCRLINEYLECSDEFFKSTGYNFLLLPNYLQQRAVMQGKIVATVFHFIIKP